MAEKEIAYTISHTRKHKLGNIFDQVDSTPIVDNALAGLWALRGHPDFYSYNSQESMLADVIGFDIAGSEIDEFYGFPQKTRDEFRKLAEPILTIPDVTDKVMQGILTDAVKAIRNEVLENGKLFSDNERALSINQKYKIGIQDLKRVFADNHAYMTFLIGYCFPRLNNSQSTVARAMGLENRLKNPREYIEKLIGKKI